MTDEPRDPASFLTLPVSILISAVLLSGSIFYFAWSGVSPDPRGNVDSPDAAPTAPAETGDPGPIGGRDVILGDPSAPVTIIEYGDFQCPFCARFFEQTEPVLIENYVKTGKAKLVYRDFAFLGPESTAAAEAAECAKDQGKFWAYHDALYEVEILDGTEHNGNLNRDLFIRLAKNLDLDESSFVACVDEQKYAAAVTESTQNAQLAGVNSTPTIFVNDRKIIGAQPYATFAAIIDSLLK